MLLESKIGGGGMVGMHFRGGGVAAGGDVGEGALLSVMHFSNAPNRIWE